MDKEKDIEEMGVIVYAELTQYCPCCEGCVGCANDNGSCCPTSRHISRALTNNGYRKADEIQKETVKNMLTDIANIINQTWGDLDGDDLRMIAKKYGVEW